MVKGYVLIAAFCCFLAMAFLVQDCAAQCTPDDCGGQSIDGCYCDAECCGAEDCCNDAEAVCGIICSGPSGINFPPLYVTDNTPDVGQVIQLYTYVDDNDSTTGSIVWDCESNGDNVHKDPFNNANGSQRLVGNCVYSVPGTYCITVCYENTNGDCDYPMYIAPGIACGPPGPPPQKRDSNGNTIFVTVSPAVIGDPYFYGFDGKVAKFLGKVDNVYNYISTPSFQLNGQIDRGVAEEGGNTLETVTRAIGVMWGDDQKSLLFSCDRHGATSLQLSIDGKKEQLASNEEVTLRWPEDEVELVWTPNIRVERSPPHLLPHNITATFRLTTANYTLKGHAAALYLNKSPNAVAHPEKFMFHFIDLGFVRHDKQECMEGAWGRSSCGHSSLEQYDEEIYNVKGDLFGTDFALNMYKH